MGDRGGSNPSRRISINRSFGSDGILLHVNPLEKAADKMSVKNIKEIKETVSYLGVSVDLITTSSMDEKFLDDIKKEEVLLYSV